MFYLRSFIFLFFFYKMAHSVQSVSGGAPPRRVPLRGESDRKTHLGGGPKATASRFDTTPQGSQNPQTPRPPQHYSLLRECCPPIFFFTRFAFFFFSLHCALSLCSISWLICPCFNQSSWVRVDFISTYIFIRAWWRRRLGYIASWNTSLAASFTTTYTTQVSLNF